MKRTVNMKRVWSIAAGAAALIIAYGLIFSTTHSPQPDFPEYSKLLSGANAYTDSLKAKGLPIPDSVTLQELRERGFLGPTDASGFEGMQVTISLKPGTADPQVARLRVRFPDGHEAALLDDGSVQQTQR